MAGQLIKRGKNKWLLRVFLGRDARGKRRYFNRTSYGTKQQAQTELTRLLRQRDLGALVEPTHDTLDDYLDHWLEVAAKPRLRPSTYDEYASQLSRYVRGELGHLKLAQLSPATIQGLYSKMLERGLSARTVRLTHTILKNALTQAVKWRTLHYNPADAVDLPKQTRQEMQAMSAEEAARFTEAARLSPWHVLYVTMLTTGLRPSEAIALKWEDIDLIGRRLTVRRSLKKVRGEWTFEPPKTPKSRRTIDLPEGTVKLLAEHPRTGELVFTNVDGGPVPIDTVSRSSFQDVVRRARIDKPLRFYDLRHTHATLLLLAGVHPKIVSERLGHSSIQITLDTYSHVLPGMQRESAAKLDAMLFTPEGSSASQERLAN